MTATPTTRLLLLLFWPGFSVGRSQMFVRFIFHFFLFPDGKEEGRTRRGKQGIDIVPDGGGRDRIT